MAGLPTTLTGLIGFIIVVGGISALLFIDLNPNNPIVEQFKGIKEEQNSMQNVFGGLNQSTNSSSVDSSTSLFSFTRIINFFIFLFYLPLTVLTFAGIITVVLSPAGGLPDEFIILDFVIVTTLLLGIYKAIRAWTDS